MLSPFSICLMIAAALTVLVANRPERNRKIQKDFRWHTPFCLGVFIAACALRLVGLTALLQGISAEEALVGMQAKALAESGGFLFSGRLTTQFPQWNGESAGPLLAVMTAPFVKLWGMQAFSVRLPLALLSIAAIPAAYGLGCELSGKSAGRFLMAVYALCPYFVLTARMTASANAAVFLLPIALYVVIAGMNRPWLLYVGMTLIAMLAYAQDVYFFAAPASIVVIAMIFVILGVKKGHVLCAALLGMVLCLPAVMTLYVNLNGLDGFTLLGMIDIPSIEGFDKAEFYLNNQYAAQGFRYATEEKIWAVTIGGLFQSVRHENIDAALYLPEGMLALTVISIPLILLGAMDLLLHRDDHRENARRCLGARMVVAAVCAILFVVLVLYGTEGVINRFGTTSMYDHSALFLFSAVLMAAGWQRMRRVSAAGVRVLSMMLGVCVLILGVHLFGGSYQTGENVYFTDYVQAAQAADKKQEDMGGRVYVTDRVYPHIHPSAASEMMYLYAVDADPRSLPDCQVIYAEGLETVERDQIYLAHNEDITAWDYDGMNYEEYGEYVVLSPQETE